MTTKNILDSLYDMFQEKIDYRIDEVEIQRTKRNLMDLISDPQKEYAVLDYGIAYERAGFRNGFKIAVQILSECLTTGRITEAISEHPFIS